MFPTVQEMNMIMVGNEGFRGLGFREKLGVHHWGFPISSSAVPLSHVGILLGEPRCIEIPRNANTANPKLMGSPTTPLYTTPPPLGSPLN